MIDHRPFASLGKANHGWLDTSHHFSFSSYYDFARMGWGALRVWNDDWIAPKSGFPPHSHANMEIITYVRSGAISHRDSLGNNGRTAAGDVQVMSAGTGITHAEYNLEDQATTLFQIWIEPDDRGAPPTWGERRFPHDDRAGHWVTLASGRDADREAGALPLRCDARLMAATLDTGAVLSLDLDPHRHCYLVPVGGRVRVGAIEAAPRDGLAITDEKQIHITALAPCELVLVDSR